MWGVLGVIKEDVSLGSHGVALVGYETETWIASGPSTLFGDKTHPYLSRILVLLLLRHSSLSLLAGTLCVTSAFRPSAFVGRTLFLMSSRDVRTGLKSYVY